MRLILSILLGSIVVLSNGVFCQSDTLYLDLAPEVTVFPLGVMKGQSVILKTEFDREYYVIESPILDSIQIFTSSGLFDKTLTESQPSRDIPVPYYLIPVIEGGTEVKMHSVDPVIVEAQVLNRDEILLKTGTKNMLMGGYCGLMLVMFLYNLFLFLSVRDKVYLYYILYILFVGLTQVTIQGYGNFILWGEWSYLSEKSLYIFGGASGVFTLAFFREFLKTRVNSPKLDLVVRGFIAVGIIAILLGVSGFHEISYRLIDINAGVGALVILISSIFLAKNNVTSARLFLIAWSVFLLAVLIFVLKDVGVFEYNWITKYALILGSAIEVILLSFALADRINQLKKEKEIEQAARIEAIEENERIITQQNVILEAKVEERTKELETSNYELQNTLGELQSTQSQLVEAEKMASLGQMTAGIAHELNNPINFVSSNISPLARDIEDVMEVLDKYESLDPEKDDFKLEWESTNELKEEIELDYVKGEIKQLLEGIQEGATRTAEIVKGLRVFSRLDEDALKKADINECLEATLVILKSSINKQVEVRKKLAVGLPEINCYPGKLNQVFVNIITNGVQATMDSKNKKDERFVEIETSYTDQQVLVRIADNGVGIPAAIKQKIFDPFFTTKEVGEGTGLGLSIVLGIMNAHKGKIEVNTQEGVGTEFLLTLPRTL